MPQITDFAELKAYVDVHNEHGHQGFREPINAFVWYNSENPGKLSDYVKAWIDDGLVIVIEIMGKAETMLMVVKNLMVFSLWGKRKDTLKKVLDKVKDYYIVIYNSEFRDRYRNITKKLDGASWRKADRMYYAASGVSSWEKLFRLP